MPMNQLDTLFIGVTVGVGIGVGARLARHHGVLGFVSGFVLSTAICFVLLAAVHGLAYISEWKKRKRRNTS